MNTPMHQEVETARDTAAILSAYMDGELLPEQRDRLWQAVKSDQVLRSDWLVYHCIGDVLRSDDAVYVSSSFGGRIKAQLDGEPHVFVPEVSSPLASPLAARSQYWRLPAAVAASVAAVLSAAFLVLPQREPAPTAQAAPGAGVGSVPALAEVAVRGVSSEYLMAHRHYSTGLAMRGVVSHVRTAGYDGQ